MDQGRYFYKGGRCVRLVAVMGFLAVLALTAGCRQGTNLGITLPPTSQLFGSLPWGIINVTYTKGFTEPSVDGNVAILLRGGDVVEILSRGSRQEKIGTVSNYWYEVKSGDQKFWVFGNQLNMFGLEMQARTASEIMREKLFVKE